MMEASLRGMPVLYKRMFVPYGENTAQVGLIYGAKACCLREMTHLHTEEFGSMDCFVDRAGRRLMLLR
jgi:hypothetical protein